MMELFGTYFDRADYLIQESEQVPLPEPKKSIPSTKWKSFRKKIQESYAKSLTKPLADNLRTTSRILDDVLADLEGARILISLLPVNDGYSVTVIRNDGNCAENLNMPYDEYEFLDYIDNEQLPPVLVDVLHRDHSDAFICGAVLAEIKDYRISADEYSYETHYVLLKPTAQTLNNDVNIIAEETSGTYKWAVDDKLVLESVLTLATAEPLCLDTSPVMAIVKNKLQARKDRFKSRPMKKMIKRNGVLLQKRVRVLRTRPAPSTLKLFDFLLERKKQQKDRSSSLSPDVKLPQHIIDVWRKTPLALSEPSEINTAQHAKAFAPPAEDIKNEDIIEVQSVVIESEGAVSCITIGQRPRDMHYFGMLQSNKYYKPNVMDLKDMNQVFSLGTETRANLYILQYQELFTEDGRRPAKVTLRYANKPPVVYHIPNQQQPWQLEQEKFVYAVESVRNVPTSKWKKMNILSCAELREKRQQYNSNIALAQKQKMLLKQQQTAAVANSSQLSSATPTLNAITSQNSSPTVFNLQGSVLTGHRLMKTKSNPGPETLSTSIQVARQARLSNDNFQVRSQAEIPVQEGGRVLLTRNNSNGNPQTFTVNSSAFATALGQIGGTVSVRLPVMAVSSQRGTNGSQDGQAQGQPATAVIRMPVGIAGSANSSGQITAALNLLGGRQNVLGNIQLAGGGGITIPASQLPPAIAMQLTSRPNAQQISLVSGLSGMAVNTRTQASFVKQSGGTSPFTIISNNDNWHIQENNIAVNQQTYAIAPQMQILPSTSRSIPGEQQSQQVQLRICNPAHLMGGAGSNEQRVTAQAAPENAKKRRITPD